MKTNFHFRLPGYLYLMMCMILVSACSTEALEPELVDQSSEKIKELSIEESLDTKTYYDNSCEITCVLEGGWDIPKKRGYKSVNVGKDTKEMSYIVYNTDSHFVVEVLYEITNESAKVDANISIRVNGHEKISERVKNGETVTHSFELPANYRPCDVINYHIKQVAYGEPVTFEGEYKLIPTCENIHPAVGQKRYGGIIVYILQPNDPGYDPDVPHGLVQAPFTLPEPLPWSEELMFTETTNNFIGGGLENTINIVAFQGEGNYAAKACADLVLNGYDDWFLPNREEIVYGYLWYDAWNPYPPTEYWTSHSASLERADHYNPDPWTPLLRFYAHKTEELYVVPFRSF